MDNLYIFKLQLLLVTDCRNACIKMSRRSSNKKFHFRCVVVKCHTTLLLSFTSQYNHQATILRGCKACRLLQPHSTTVVT